MKIQCIRCQAVYSIDESLLRASGIRARCPACGDVRVIQPTPDPFAAIGLPERPPADPPSESHPASTARPSDRSTSQLPPLPSLQLARPAPPAGPVGGADSVGPQPMDIGRGVDAGRCERCGGVVSGSQGPDGLCERCRQLKASRPTAGQEQRDWRIRLSNGVILGPLALEEVKHKYSAGEIGAGDQLARAEGDFRLVSSFAELAVFFKRPGEAVRLPASRPAPSGAKAWMWIALFALVVVLGLGLWLLWPRLFAAGEDDALSVSVVEEALERFAAEIGKPEGTSDDSVAKGRQAMLRDERLGYLEADRCFKAALLLDPSDQRAYAGWVQNRSLLDLGGPNVGQRKVALDLIDHALSLAPGKSSLLRAKAFLLYSLGRLSEARQLAQRVLAELEDDPETQLVLGATYLDANTERAVELFQRALEGNRDLNLAFRLLGEAKVRLGQFHQAIGLFNKRLETDPAHHASLEALARLYLTVGKLDKARRVYEHILTGDPSRVAAAVALARLAYQFRGRLRQALKLLDGLLEAEALRLSPIARARLLAEKSVVLRLQGALPAAGEAVERALKLDPMSVPALHSQAVLALKSGDLGAAIARLRSLRSHLPRRARVRLLLGEAEAQVSYQRIDEAVKHFQAALELDPLELDGYLILASLYLELDNPDQAYAWLRKATEVDPFYQRSHRAPTAYFEGPDLLRYALGRAKSGAKKYGEDPLAQALIGVVFWRSGQDDQAQARFIRALHLDEECLPANLYMGALFLANRQPRRALPYLQKAHQSDGLHPVAGVLLAYARLKTGSAKRAEQLVQAVLKSHPGHLAARQCLGEVRLARKRKLGLQTLLKVYQADPDNVRVKELLFDLGS